MGPAERARHPAQVDPAVDAAAVERVRAVAQPPHLVRRLQLLQAHDARRSRRRRRGVVAARRRTREKEAAELDGRELLLDLLRQRSVVHGAAVVAREAAEADDGEHRQEGVPDGAEEPEEGDHRLGDDETVAHQRESHDRPPKRTSNDEGRIELAARLSLCGCGLWVRTEKKRMEIGRAHV